jgi:hypothetical protein
VLGKVRGTVSVAGWDMQWVLELEMVSGLAYLCICSSHAERTCQVGRAHRPYGRQCQEESSCIGSFCNRSMVSAVGLEPARAAGLVTVSVTEWATVWDLVLDSAKVTWSVKE